MSEAILISNLGTSDLSTQVTVDNETYYLPIDYLTNEANLSQKTEQLNPQRQAIWKNQRTHLPNSQVYQDLGFDNQLPTSRDLTERLLQKYQEEPDKWHQLIRPTRIGGVIDKAIKMGAKKAYIFVTNQEIKHEKDTIFLFKILQQWCQQEYPEFILEYQAITFDLNPQNPELEDSLFQYYYNKLNNICQQEGVDKSVLISVKGGTQQMKTALQIQAISSPFKKILFLDQQLDLNRLLEGKTSECELTTYWLYQRNQKYQTVQLLLEKRWDFDGAKVILEEWKSILKFFQENLKTQNQEATPQLDQEIDKLESVSIKLNYAVDKLNFAAIRPENRPDDLCLENDIIDKMLNLYTQCRIYWNLNEISNFLPRLGSFYEESLQVIIRHFIQPEWFINKNKNEKWVLIKNKLPKDIVINYEKIQREDFGEREKIYWNHKGVNNNHYLANRYFKRSFVKALIETRNQDLEQNCLDNILISMKRLDFWVDRRNKLVHGSQGLSIETMEQELETYRKIYNQNPASQENPFGPDPAKTSHYKDILGQMTMICQETLKLIGQPPHSCVNFPQNTPYYLYSEIKDWVINTLNKSSVLKQ